MEQRARRISTAMAVAAGTLLDADAAGLGQQLSARLARACLEESGAAGRRLLRLLDRRGGRALLRCAQALVLPGIAAHYRWRKRRIRAWVQARTDAGASQLIVLGAGFDALAAGLVRTVPRLRAIEIDLAVHQRAKRRALRRLGLEHSRLGLVEADLRTQALPGLLAGAAGFDRHAPSVVVAEGLLMYLPPPSLQALFGGLAAALSTPATVIATAMETGAGGAPGFRGQRPWLRHWLRRRGEPFLWGCAPAALPASMRGHGLRLDAIADPAPPHDPDPCPGEWLFRATLPGLAPARLTSRAGAAPA
ncbi:class I SAM-dependent methyltransferase [Luteimonas sp. SJ-92]|uniref:Class I SAM-dependent methyltransferase n=1 Tax=Luteimonas salinisoli TaxID=2752307 RepID=A0A853JCA7_9GAMM|nr:class I SAM-dependent methyltransferase [Luteimonas salinisoli]NZA26277.1 class I SAM-dependent methyltransferase [Luteimonas salinisoli]